LFVRPSVGWSLSFVTFVFRTTFQASATVAFDVPSAAAAAAAVT